MYLRVLDLAGLSYDVNSESELVSWWRFLLCRLLSEHKYLPTATAYPPEVLILHTREVIKLDGLQIYF